MKRRTGAARPVSVGLAGFALALLAAPLLAQDTSLPPSRWALTEIQFMDDRTVTPKDGESYTLDLRDDGSVAMQSDCNQLQGQWASPVASKLTFSGLVSTMALCGPDSLDETYRAQFEWVRSYVLRDGQLFLATMADGAILSFDPVSAPPVVARLQGDDVRLKDPEAVQGHLLQGLFSTYAVQQGLTASEAEVERYLADVDRTLAEELGDERETGEDLSDEEQASLRSMRSSMGRTMIEHWKVNQALFNQYGGRVIYQQFGPEPLDAYRAFLEERREAGDFELLDADIEREFWAYFENDERHAFYTPEEAKAVFQTAPWDD